MKRYLLFAGDEYYPNRGWKDFKGDFDTEPEAFKQALRCDRDWYQIVDTETKQIIFQF